VQDACGLHERAHERMEEAVCSLRVERVRGPCKYVLATVWMVGVVCVLGATQEVLLVGLWRLGPYRGCGARMRPLQQASLLGISQRDSAGCCTVQPPDTQACTSCDFSLRKVSPDWHACTRSHQRGP
jgi:hypothetical protein